MYKYGEYISSDPRTPIKFILYTIRNRKISAITAIGYNYIEYASSHYSELVIKVISG